jgi:hypothetical protein
VAVLSWDQVAAVALEAGWPPGPAAFAVAITMPESGRNATIVQAGQPYATTGWGLWQITPGNSVPQFGTDEQLLHAINNARAGHAKWAAAGGFSPWTTYEDGAYAPYMGLAEAAVGRVAHLSKAQIAKLAAAASKGGAVLGLSVTSSEDWAPRVRHARWHVHVAARHLHGYAEGIGGIRVRHPRIAVHVPAPGSLAWKPGERLPDA